MESGSPPALRRAAVLRLVLRAETGADRLFTTRLYASTRAEELAPVPWSEADKAAFLASQHDAQHDHYRQHYGGAGWFIVEHGDVPVGRLYLVRWTKEIRIIDIAFVPEARGRGFGAALLSDVMDEAATAGRAVTIHVERLNRALSLYRRLGFETIEDKGVYLLLGWRPAMAR